MAINSSVVGSIAAAEDGKFVQIVGDTSFPQVSVTKIDYSNAWNGLPPVSSIEVYNKYAVLTYAVGGSAASQPGGSVSSSTIAPNISANGVVVAANPTRNILFIQNLATTPLYVSYGGTASATVFNFILKGGTAANDGSGEKWRDTNWKGSMSVFSATTPSFVTWEA